MNSVIESNWAMLRRVLVTGYDDIANALARRLGSRDLASEALQDAYLRIERGGELENVQSPRAYIIRMALNIATDKRRAANRVLTVGEGEMLLGLRDDAPGPDRIAESRSNLNALRRIIDELPPRRRAIFAAAWIEGQSHAEIARRFGVALRTVQQELKLAREYCAAQLGGQP